MRRQERIRRGSKRGGKRRGTAMIEMAIVLPVLVLIIFAIVEFGIAFQRWQVLTNAAREGARAASVRTGVCDPNAVTSTVSNYITVSGLNPGQFTVDPTNPCVDAGQLIPVTVRHQFVFPVLSSLIPGLENGLPLMGRAIMRKE